MTGDGGGSSAPTGLDPASRARTGRAVRTRLPRSELGSGPNPDGRADPVELVTGQATTRLAELVPIRHGRMGASPFAFYRGAAIVMAADLAARPSTGLEVQLCGDAHLANFGGFASPERSLVFDVNDFDETLAGPFEWDLERLAASIEIAARALSFDDAMRSAAVTAAVRSYREAIRRFAAMTRLDVWYSRLDLNTLMATWGTDLGTKAVKRFERTVDKAGSKDRLRAKARLTHVVDGSLQFRSDPPLLVRAEELVSTADHEALVDTVGRALHAYRGTLSTDRRHLLNGYRFVDLARKVVGVGSVGTRCWVALLVGRDDDDPLVLQVKEAEASVLETHLGPSPFANHGQRVVAGQQLMQSSSDIFLGWERTDGVDGLTHDYYMRQLWDWKASADLTRMEPDVFGVYGQMCGWVLARAHARSGDPIAIGSYLGKGPIVDNAMARFASAYADQNELDHQGLVAGIASGRVEAIAGV